MSPRPAKYPLITSVSLVAALLTTPLLAQTAPTPPAQTAPPPAGPKPQDFPNLHRYHDEDAALPTPTPGQPRVVFFGDSITDNWGHHVGTFFPGKPYVNRGIGGQTTPQMLLRFEQDVVALHPAAVVILAGTNDIAGNTGLSTPEMIQNNFRAMVSIAKQNGIRVVIASILPAAHFGWSPTIQPVPLIREMNLWLKQFALAQNLVYLDYYTPLADENGAMKPGLSSDGVHPTVAGYAIMAPLAEAAIAQALAKRP